MKRKTVLLTGDDGYNSLGTRVLLSYLKEDFDCSIAGTLTQQSGVGGHKHIVEGGDWGKAHVDSIDALWLDGSPVDVMEAARIYFKKQFDYCISGINWGPNIDGCLFSSGTFAAAYYAQTLGVAKRTIAISWDLPVKHHFVRHAHTDSIQEFLIHPGESANAMIRLGMKENLWGADIININLPQQQSNIIEFATPLSSVHGFWPPILLDKTSHRFSYGHGERGKHIGKTTSEDQVLERNHISVVLCQATMGNFLLQKKMKKRKIRI